MTGHTGSPGIFDSVAHVQFNLVERPAKTLALVENRLKRHGVTRALSVNLPSLNEHLTARTFIAAHEESQFFLPVPSLNSTGKRSVVRNLSEIAASGCRIVKVHPRLLNLNYNSPRLKMIVREVQAADLSLMLCAYPYRRSVGLAGEIRLSNSLEYLCPRGGFQRLLLLHGGGPQLSDLAEWARHQGNVFIDLSIILTQFMRTSVGLDLAGLVDRFEQRLVIGSDYPFESLDLWSSSVSRLLDGVDDDTRIRITRSNLEEFVGE